MSKAAWCGNNSEIMAANGVAMAKKWHQIMAVLVWHQRRSGKTWRARQSEKEYGK